jgi:hypothetical protein
VVTFQRVPEPPPVIGQLVEERQVVIGGRPATVREFEAAEPHLSAGSLVYQYLIQLDDGELLLVGIDSAQEVGDYAEHRQVLDLMMQTLELDA